ncbi:MAG TPA: hypothetical protein VK900_18460 [Anaerolineales bacterium]|nr:hypothetical protein [Anaerolineales bacterium]
MARKISAGILIALSATLLVLSVLGIVAVWFYNEPMTHEATTLLGEIEGELEQTEVTLASSERELERALRIVDNAQTALEALAQQTEGAESLFETIQSTLDERLLPELKQARTRIESARIQLESLDSILTGISNFIPGIDLSLPSGALRDLIASARTIDAEIANAEVLGTQASTFVADTGYLLGGDLTETRESLQSFLTAIQEYQEKVVGWREQVQELNENAPRWIDQASIILTLFLIWFGISQFGLLLHGLHIQQGNDPFMVLRRAPRDEIIVTDEDIDLELRA